MDPIWIVHLEVVAFVEGAPAKGKLGFINVVVSAGDAKNARSKVITVLESYDWKILRIQSVVVADSDLTYKDDLEELIENVKTNPHLVLLSTLHCYKA